MAIGAILSTVVGGLGLLERRKERKQAGQGAATADPFASQRGQFQDLLSNLFGLPGTSKGGTAPKDVVNVLEDLKKQKREGIPQNRGGAISEEQGQADLDSRIANLEQEVAGFGGLEGDRGGQRQDFLQNLPGLQFAIEQGTKAATRRASAQGTRISGGLLQEIQRGAQGQAQQSFFQLANLLSNLGGANVGQPGVAGQIQAGAPNPLTGTGEFLATLPNLFSQTRSPTATTTPTSGGAGTGINFNQPFQGQSPNLSIFGSQS